MSQLTKTQAKVHRWIQKFHAKHHYPPTLQEISEAMGFANKSGVQCHIKALRAKGRVVQTPGKSRTILAI